ncbi:hypothetical protein H9P43_009331 [Blastocladiella emersonii ATCC 22665]|nr:hypothetical protein H9P43_009331 [Blastocladiella emersonii ATCC 22665]
MTTMLRIPFTLPPASELQALVARLPPAPAHLAVASYTPPSCHSDLALERSRAGAKALAEDVSLLIHDDDALVREFKRRLNGVLELLPTVGAPQVSYFLNKEQLYARACRAMAEILGVVREYAIPRAMQVLVWEAAGELVPLFLHCGMFIPTIENLGSEEQKREWLPKCLDLTMIGAYAQTEVGHGSNVAGLETTATFDPATDEFIIETPTLTAYKCWPGALAHTANHALVLAQIVVAGKSHGVHPIMVQLRDHGSHEPRAGVSLTDLGPKLSFNTMDNGFLSLKGVRVPRTNLLGGSLRVTSSGAVTPVAASALVYKTMLQMRAGIVMGASQALWRGCTVATRYSVVRRQFAADPSTSAGESAILDYESQQYKIAVPLAASFAFHFAGRTVDALVASAGTETRALRHAHIVSSCLKVVTTNATTTYLETLRRALGGHGYAKTAGLADLATTYAQMVTVEGENTVLARQVVRAFAKPDHGLFAESAAVPVVADWTDASAVAAFLESRATAQITRYRATRSLVVCDAMCTTAGWALVFRALARGIAETADRPVARILRPCVAVLASHVVLEATAEVGGDLTRDDVSRLYAAQAEGLKAIRPWLVAVTDGFGFTDREMAAAAGRSDGNVYETMLQWAKEHEPLNRHRVNPAFKEFMVPLMGKGVGASKL